MSDAAAEREPDAVAALRRADERYREADARVADHGKAAVETVASAYDRATALLDRYDDRATGTGTDNFKAYVEFREEFSEFVEGLDDDLMRRDAFEAAEDRLDKRRLSASDFAAARETLSPAGELASLLEERDDALVAYREARGDVRRRLSAVDDEIAETERRLELGDADLDAPVDDLREPVAAYDDAVDEAFRTFQREESARTVLSLVETTRLYPLVEFRPVPEDLLSYVRTHDAGDEPIPTLLSYAEYSRSKLSHYVEDPDELKRRVATQQTYLERLSAEPLTVGWPPPPADVLRWRARELLSVVDRFAPEDVTERLRTVRALALNADRYGRLRDAAIAREELDAEQRRRLAAGETAAELDRLRDRRAALADALDALPDR